MPKARVGCGLSAIRLPSSCLQKVALLSLTLKPEVRTSANGACGNFSLERRRPPELAGKPTFRQYKNDTRMTRPLQAHYDHVSALLRALRTALEDDAVFRSRREIFDEYLEANELELALHSACAALLEQPHGTPSTAVLQNIADSHKAMDLPDDCVENLAL